MYWGYTKLVVYSKEPLSAMDKLKKNNLLSPFKYPHQQGFTLIELLVSLTIIAILSTISIASYSNYTKSQILESSVRNVATMFQTAKSRSQSQVKPQVCENQTLEGYKITITMPDTYILSVVCDRSSYVIDQKTLPSTVTFTNQSASSILFNVSTGTVANQAKIVIQGNNKEKTITIQPAGVISIQ